MTCNFGIVLTTSGLFGGAERRFTNLFRYLYKERPQSAFFFVSSDLLSRITSLHPDYPLDNLLPVVDAIPARGRSEPGARHAVVSGMENPSVSRKLHRYLRNYYIQYRIYRRIEAYRRKLNINVLMGVFSGILPLYFYLAKENRSTGIIFSDMDSWFSNVHCEGQELWYRKYSTFNFGLENSDHVDFLSPFVLNGVRERGINLRERSVSVAPSSFADYSQCESGDKSRFQVAFSARLEKDKNPEVFLEAALRLSEKYPEIVFHIMGEGRLSESIRERAKNSGRTNIIFHGFHPMPSRILAQTSVFVSVQSTNNYPSQSVLEAMACGNAIVATDVGDTRMFVNERNGILIKSSTEQLISAVERLYKSRELTKDLGNYAYSYVRKEHTIENSAKYYLTLFETIGKCGN